MSIRILVTGGTFDKEYNERTGQLFFKDTMSPEMLGWDVSRVDPHPRDDDRSLKDDADRTLIVQTCLIGGRASSSPRAAR